MLLVSWLADCGYLTSRPTWQRGLYSEALMNSTPVREIKAKKEKKREKEKKKKSQEFKTCQLFFFFKEAEEKSHVVTEMKSTLNTIQIKQMKSVSNI